MTDKKALKEARKALAFREQERRRDNKPSNEFIMALARLRYMWGRSKESK